MSTGSSGNNFYSEIEQIPSNAKLQLTEEQKEKLINATQTMKLDWSDNLSKSQRKDSGSKLQELPQTWNDWGSTPTRLKNRNLIMSNQSSTGYNPENYSYSTIVTSANNNLENIAKSTIDAPLPTFVQSTIEFNTDTNTAQIPLTNNFDFVTSTRSQIVEMPTQVERPAPLDVETINYYRSQIVTPKTDAFQPMNNTAESLRNKLTIANIMLKEKLFDNSINYFRQTCHGIENGSLQMAMPDEYLQALNGLCESYANKRDWASVEENAKKMPGSANGFDDYWTAKACLELGQKDKATIFAKQAKAKLGEQDEKVISLMNDLNVTDARKRSYATIEEIVETKEIEDKQTKEDTQICENNIEEFTTKKVGKFSTLGKYTGRFMYAAFWIITGFCILNEAENYGKDLSKNYTDLHNVVQTNYNQTFTLPQFMNPTELEANQTMIVYILACIQIAMGVLSAVAIPAFPIFLSLLMTFMTFIWHNPLQHSTMSEVYQNCGPWVMNVGIIGAGLLMCCEARNA